MSFDLHVKIHKEDVTDAKETPCSDCGAMFYLDKARDFHFNSVHSRSERGSFFVCFFFGCLFVCLFYFFV